MKKVKALVLLSGGLDSMLAVKVLKAQQIEVVGLCFSSNFYDCSKAREAATQLEIELKEVDISEAMLGLVKNPSSGHGKNINPCIDCHGLMIRLAGEIAKEEGFGIVATGEVLGQRPFSQNKESLGRVAKIASVPVLRPLSAMFLDETEVEKKGLVDRTQLLDISGRGRERQLELAKEYGIVEFPSPAGGCLLTDPGFSERGKKLLENWEDCSTDDIELIKNGRVFWLTLENGEKALLMIGRDKEENKRLEELAQKGDIMVELKGIMGPTAIIRSRKTFLKIEKELIDVEIPIELKLEELNLLDKKNKEEILNTVGFLTGYYAVKARGEKIKIEFSKI